MRKCSCGKRLSGVGRKKAYSRNNKKVVATCGGGVTGELRLGKTDSMYFIETIYRGRVRNKYQYVDDIDASNAFRRLCESRRYPIEKKR
jgi:hypothetical protein